jgi:hypothetical protein
MLYDAAEIKIRPGHLVPADRAPKENSRYHAPLKKPSQFLVNALRQVHLQL